MACNTIVRVFILLFFTAFSITATAEEVTTDTAKKTDFNLNDLYSLALEEAEQIHIAKEELYIAQSDKVIARSVLMPRFTAFGGYTISDSDVENDPAAPPIIPAEYNEEKDTLSWGVRFDQSITLNGKEITRYNMAKELIKKSNFDLSTVKEDYLYQVASAYYQVLRAAKAKEIAKANVERLKTHRDAVAARLRLEEVTRTDMYRAESELSDAEAQLIEAGNQFIYYRAVLKNLVNVPSEYSLIEPPEDTFDAPTPNLDELKAKGLSMRSEAKAAKIDSKVSEKNVKLSKGAYWPTLSLEGKYAESDDTIDGSASYDQDSSGYSIGANLTFTLFDGGLRNSEVKQAKARSRQKRLILDTTNKNIALEIESAFLNLENQKSKLVSLTDKLKFSTQNYNAVTQQFKHGLANSVDMMDANTLLVEAERQLSDAQFGYRLAWLRLNRTTGVFLSEAGYAETQENPEKG